MLCGSSVKAHLCQPHAVDIKQARIVACAAQALVVGCGQGALSVHPRIYGGRLPQGHSSFLEQSGTPRLDPGCLMNLNGYGG